MMSWSFVMHANVLFRPSARSVRDRLVTNAAMAYSASEMLEAGRRVTFVRSPST